MEDDLVGILASWENHNLLRELSSKFRAGSLSLDEFLSLPIAKDCGPETFWQYIHWCVSQSVQREIGFIRRGFVPAPIRLNDPSYNHDNLELALSTLQMCRSVLQHHIQRIPQHFGILPPTDAKRHLISTVMSIRSHLDRVSWEEHFTSSVHCALVLGEFRENMGVDAYEPTNGQRVKGIGEHPSYSACTYLVRMAFRRSTNAELSRGTAETQRSRDRLQELGVADYQVIPMPSPSAIFQEHYNWWAHTLDDFAAHIETTLPPRNGGPIRTWQDEGEEGLF